MATTTTFATTAATETAAGANTNVRSPPRAAHTAPGAPALVRGGVADSGTAAERDQVSLVGWFINPNQRMPNKNLARLNRRNGPVVNASLRGQR
jgi:hypothetical protein